MYLLMDRQFKSVVGRFESFAEASTLYRALVRLHPPAVEWLTIVAEGDESEIPTAA